MARNDKSASIGDEVAVLQRIEEHLTVITKILLSEKLDEIAEDPKQWMIYEGAGSIPAKDLAKRAHVSFTTISGLWQKWTRQGLMIPELCTPPGPLLGG